MAYLTIVSLSFPCPPPENGRGGGEGGVGPLLLLLLHLDGPHLAVQRQRRHAQATVLHVVVNVVQISETNITSYKKREPVC